MKKRRVPILFKPQEGREMERYLEQMAAKGWMLEKMNGAFLTFCSIEPAAYRFAVDLFTDTQGADRVRTDAAESYRACCEEAGWTYVDGFRYMQVFYTEADKEVLPLQTDEVIHSRILRKCLWKEVWSSAIGWVIYLLFWIVLCMATYKTWVSNYYLFVGGVLAVVTVWELVHAIAALKDVIQNARGKERKPWTLNKLLLIKYLERFGGSLLIIGCLLICAYDYVRYEEKSLWLVKMAPYFLGLVVGSVVQTCVNRSREPKETKEFGVIAGIFLAVVVTFGVNAVYSLYKGSEDVVQKEQEFTEYLVMNGTEFGGDIFRIDEERSSSLLIPEYYEYTEYDDVFFQIRITYLEARSERLARKIMENMAAYVEQNASDSWGEQVQNVVRALTGRGYREAMEKAVPLETVLREGFTEEQGTIQAWYWDNGTVCVQSGSRVMLISCSRNPEKLLTKLPALLSFWFGAAD
ncbi:MAG: DUF2812 domain-containing protein [Lachnospiraceae bacterium]|nr:DUF2812 domain-containing protein [Lachnospiraceae bacterium]